MDGPYLIRGKLLWDGIGDKAVPNAAISVDGNRIKAVGPYEIIKEIPHKDFFDLGDVTLMPGLIDCHTHLSMDAAMADYLEHMSDPIPQLSIRAVAMMKKDLESGVTTCRCCGDKGLLDIACRKDVEGNKVSGPRLLVAAKGIRASRGHGFVGYPFDGIEQIINAVHENIRAGADLIKIYISGTLRGEGDLPSFLTREEIKAAIDEAHKKGLRVAAHCVGGIGLDWALELGLDSLEHAYHITEEQVKKLAKSTTRVVLTPGSVLSDERIYNLPARLVEGHFQERDEMTSSMSNVIEAQLQFALGTDGLHGDMAAEMMHAVNLGASLLTALKAATIWGAGVCGISGITGSLEPGKDADIIAVKGNPLEKIKVIKNIKAVIVRGKIIRYEI
ncbi:MAG TPA: amidohydrolase family protein [Cyclobacteriaceae bacterium]|nr:amidohydrolase family protein [Cyclobacteriaceae bacterium]